MKLRYLLFFMGLFLLVSCKDSADPEPEPEKPEPEKPEPPQPETPTTFLTVTLTANYTWPTEQWVFATDQTGKVLDAIQVTSGATFTLKALTAPDVVNFTTYTNGGTSKRDMFYTYEGVAKGSHITLDKVFYQYPPPVSGTATLNLQNCNPYSTLTISDGLGYAQASPGGNTSLNTVYNVRQATSKLLVTGRDSFDKPVYRWLENIAQGGNYNVDFLEFTPLPKTVSIPYTGSVVTSIFGWKGDENSVGYVMANDGVSTTPGASSVASFGYLDGFDTYRLFASSTALNHPDYSMFTQYYFHYGTTLPEEVTLSNNTLTIVNPSPENLSFTFSSDYTYRMHEWNREVDGYFTSWFVYTDKSSNAPIKEIPAALVTKFPHLSLSNMKLSKSDFYKYEDGYTYAKFRDETFAGTQTNRHIMHGTSAYHK